MNELSLAVVGIDYLNDDGSNRRFEAKLCAPGEAVELRPEPKNKHDRNAIAVVSSRGVQVGYVSAERCSLIRAKLEGGNECRAVFQELLSHAAVIRARFDGQAPTLPPVRQEVGRVDHCDDAPVFEGDDWGC